MKRFWKKIESAKFLLFCLKLGKSTFLGRSRVGRAAFLYLIFTAGCIDSKQAPLQAPLSDVIDLKYEFDASSLTRCIDEEEKLMNMKRTKTFAEIEGGCIKKAFLEKKVELDTLFQKIVLEKKQEIKKLMSNPEESERVKIFTKRVEELIENQRQFNIFVENYGKKCAEPYLRAYRYHYYGSMFDLLNLRIKHLKIGRTA